ncbi:hypothetical protein [Pseudonocardia sp. T1-2H]|uniref:hypothetical protein n=1 Tax=Pseudonocardia sp. T1-2H TaxID=3128899 RepID=UPI003100AC87
MPGLAVHAAEAVLTKAGDVVLTVARRLLVRATQPPAPSPTVLPSGIAVWEGGVEVLGPLLKIPGRTLDVEHLEDARQHVAAVNAAIDHLETRHA